MSNSEKKLEEIMEELNNIEITEYEFSDRIAIATKSVL